jgi:TonB family protein
MARRRMSKIALLPGFILLFSGPLKAHQEWQEISQETAESHLLKKVDPVFPAFAKAAGVEGVVRIRVGINTNGRIGSVEIKSGPPCLFKAAEDAVLQYVYRPFEINGHLVNADTTVDVAFKLPKQHNVERSYPPPLVAELTFSLLESSKPPTHVSASLQKWVDEELQRKRTYFSCDASTPTDDDKIIQVPVVDPTAQLYLLFPHERCMCGASGNCPFELAEVDARGVQTVIDSMGGAFALRRRQGAQVPDIFSISHMSAEYADIAGFVKIGRTWGQFYCGKYFNSDTEKSEIHVCR